MPKGLYEVTAVVGEEKYVTKLHFYLNSESIEEAAADVTRTFPRCQVEEARWLRSSTFLSYHDIVPKPPNVNIRNLGE